MNHDVLLTRESAQQEIGRLEARIRRRLAGKIRALSRGVYDLDDVMASARRRIDVAAGAGAIRARTEVELAAYIFGVAERVAFHGLRRERRQHACARRVAHGRGNDGASKTSSAQGREITGTLSQLTERDRTSLNLWARGLSHAHIAWTLGITLGRHRSRWLRIVTRLRRLFATRADASRESQRD